MKNKLLILSIAFVCLFGCLALAACDLFETTSNSDKTQTQQPDNSTDGDKDDNQGESDDNPHTHEYVMTINKPTKTKEGSATGKCKFCDDVLNAVLPVLTDSKYVKTQDTATCGKGGSVQYTVNIDGSDYNFSVATPATGVHNYVKGVCTCGAKDPDYIEHTHAYEKKSNESGHWTECACGAKTQVTAHVWTDGKDDNYHWKVCSVGNEINDKVAHSFIGGECACGAKKAVNELEYALNSDGKGYSVVGIGTVTDEHIVIPEKYNGLPVVEIADDPFIGSVITEITVPFTVKKIGSFYADEVGLTRVNYTGTAAEWATIDFDCGLGNSHMMFSSRGLYIGGQHVTEVEISNVDRLGKGYAYSDIVSVVIGSGVKAIESGAFFNCKSLESVEFTDGNVPYNHNSMFTACYSLKTVKLPDDFEVISVSMFSGCYSLNGIELPKGLKYINEEAFRGTGLNSVSIPASVVRIGGAAFFNCENLQSVNFEDVSGWQSEVYSNLHHVNQDAWNVPNVVRVGIMGEVSANAAQNALLLAHKTEKYRVYTLSDEGGAQASKKVESDDGYGYSVVVGGKNYYFALSLSLCKQGTKDVPGGTTAYSSEFKRWI